MTLDVVDPCMSCGHDRADHLPVDQGPCVGCACRAFVDWPNCAMPDCGHKRSMWSGTLYCTPCARELLGNEEMDRRFQSTRSPSGGWNGRGPTVKDGR